jgi:hypothetical protein
MSTEKRANPIPGLQSLVALFEQSPIPIEYYDAKGKWEAGNAAAMAIFGMAYEDTVGFDLFTDEAIPIELRVKLKRGEPIRFQTDFDFSKVTYKTVRTDIAKFDLYITPLIDRDRKIMGFMVQTLDMAKKNEL